MARRKIGPRRSSTIAVDINKVSQELRGIILEEGIEILGELAQRIAEEANKNAPVLSNPLQSPKWKEMHRNGTDKTGPIKGHVVGIPSPNRFATWLVMSPSWYSHFVEYGTMPHDMKPKTQKAMSFFVGNENGVNHVFAKFVKHPGMKKKPFLRPAADMADQFIKEILNKRYGV